MTLAPAMTSRDRIAGKPVSRAAALVVAVLAMVVEIAPAVFLMAGAGSLATVLANETGEESARVAPATDSAARQAIAADRSSRAAFRITEIAPEPVPTAPAVADLLRRLDLPPPAIA
jgi:hypothetical protein